MSCDDLGLCSTACARLHPRHRGTATRRRPYAPFAAAEGSGRRCTSSGSNAARRLAMHLGNLCKEASAPGGVRRPGAAGEATTRPGGCHEGFLAHAPALTGCTAHRARHQGLRGGWGAVCRRHGCGARQREGATGQLPCTTTHSESSESKERRALDCRGQFSVKGGALAAALAPLRRRPAECVAQSHQLCNGRLFGEYQLGRNCWCDAMHTVKAHATHQGGASALARKHSTAQAQVPPTGGWGGAAALQRPFRLPSFCFPSCYLSVCSTGHGQ